MLSEKKDAAACGVLTAAVIEGAPCGGSGHTNDVYALRQPEVRTQYSNRLPGCTRKLRTVITGIVIDILRDMRRMGKKRESEGPAVSPLNI